MPFQKTLRLFWPILVKIAMKIWNYLNHRFWSETNTHTNRRWDLTDVGVMDRTHLRWFTPDSFKEMFSTSGYDVISVKSISPFRINVKLKLLLLLGRG